MQAKTEPIKNEHDNPNVEAVRNDVESIKAEMRAETGAIRLEICFIVGRQTSRIIP